VPIANEVIFSREKGDNTSESKIKISKGEERYFILTTHNPLFYNVLFNELSRSDNKSEIYPQATA